MSEIKLSKNDGFKVYTGTYKQAMQELLKDGRTPLTTSDIMRGRINAMTNTLMPQNIKDAWTTYHYDTCDAVFYHTTNKARVIVDSDMLKGKEPLADRFLGGTQRCYERQEGLELAVEEIIHYSKLGQPKEFALANPIWKHLAQDEALLQTYANQVFENSPTSKENYAMETELDRTNIKKIRMDCIRVNGFGGGSRISGIDVRFETRLIGATPDYLDGLRSQTYSLQETKKDLEIVDGEDKNHTRTGVRVFTVHYPDGSKRIHRDNPQGNKPDGKGAA